MHSASIKVSPVVTHLTKPVEVEEKRDGRESAPPELGTITFREAREGWIIHPGSVSLGTVGNVQDTGIFPLFCVSPCSQDLFAEDNPVERLNHSAGVAPTWGPRMGNFHPPISTLDFGLGRKETFRHFYAEYPRVFFLRLGNRLIGLSLW
jgi:hypothetical protein